MLASFYQLGWTIAIWLAVYTCLKTFKTKPNKPFIIVWLQLITYHGRWWVLWVLLWANIQLMIDSHALYWLISMLALLYLYMTWIEPNRLRVSHQQINMGENTGKTLKLAVLGDVHFGIFHHKHQLKRWVKCVNRLDVDAVVVTGDWLYHAGADIVGQMMLIKAINKPIFTSFSQADIEQQIGQSELIPNVKLNDILKILDVTILQNQSVQINDFQLIGIGADMDKSVIALLKSAEKQQQKTVILTHDVKDLQENVQFINQLSDNSLIIAGQTHGGQVKIPFVTPKFVKAMTGNRYLAGHYWVTNPQHEQTSRYQIWINTGVGMTGLPYRLFCPPQIDVLTIVA